MNNANIFKQEIKEQVVKLVLSGEQSASNIAKSLGIPVGIVRQWIKTMKVTQNHISSAPLLEDNRLYNFNQEYLALKQTIIKLKLMGETLKKVTMLLKELK